MTARLRQWLIRLSVGGVTLLILLVGALYALVGTERGTRWALEMAIELVPLDLQAAGISGTLLTRLEVDSLRLTEPARVVMLAGLIVEINWTNIAAGHIAFERLAAREVRLQTMADVERDSGPLELDMPAVPLRISGEAISIDRLLVDDLTATNIVLRELTVYGQQLSASFGAADIETVSVSVRDLSGELAGDVSVIADIDWRLADDQWSGSASIGGSLRQLEFRHELRGEFPAVTDGTLRLLQVPEPAIDAVTTFGAWRYQDWLASAGRVHVVGSASDYRAAVALSIENGQALSARLTGNLVGDTEALRSIDIALESSIAKATATGTLAWSPKLQTELLIVAREIDPSTLIAIAPGNLDAEFRLTAGDASEFALEIVSLSGTYNAQSAQAKGRLSRQGDAWRCANCRLSVGRNQLAVDGALDGRSVTAHIDIDAPSLEQLATGFAGSLQANGRVSGSLSLPAFSGSAMGSGLGIAGWSLGSVTVASDASSVDNVDLVVSANDVARDAVNFGGASLRVVGDAGTLDIQADWSLDDLSASASASVTVGDDSVSGTVTSAEFSEPYTGAWKASDSFDFSVAPAAVRVGDTIWSNGTATLRQNAIALDDGQLQADLALSDGPLSALNALLPKTVRIDGFVDAEISLEQVPAGWTGDVRWTQRETLLRLSPVTDEVYELAIPTAEAEVTLVDGGAVATANIGVDPGLTAALEASLDRLTPDALLVAHFQMSGSEWDWLTAFVPEIESLQGTVTSDITASGSLSSPDLGGELRLTEGAFVVPSLNLPLSAINVVLTGTSAGDMTIDGNARAGDGTLRVTGRLDDIVSGAPEFTVQLKGDGADLLGWSDYQLTASPDLTLTGNPAGVHLGGTVDVDRAIITVRRLPEGAIKPSAEVSVEGREEKATGAARVTGEVDLLLGDSVHIQAFGLDTNLEGELHMILPENREPAALGELRLVDGFFQMYGQRLEIEQGTMVFAGPLDDPRINLRAVREIDDVSGAITVGIELRGSAQNLTSSIYSNPAMLEAEALSYLLLGRPLGEATSADGNALANSAYALGLRGAGAITNQIGQSVGLDELAVRGNNQNTAELVSGKQINSRLYARYAYGVFSKLGNLLLRYRLSESFAIEMSSGEAQSMDILYTIERP